MPKLVRSSKPENSEDEIDYLPPSENSSPLFCPKPFHPLHIFADKGQGREQFKG
jgi:hypothetical protein